MLGPTSLDVCTFCNERMKDPRILSGCAHSFCLNCLEKSAATSDTTKCPKCDRVFSVPQGGLKQLKKNDFIRRLLDLNKERGCESCWEDKAAIFCITCSCYYCSECLRHHNRLESTCNHQFRANLTTSENDENANDAYPVCEDHSDVMNILCLQCDLILCGQCFMTEHRYHDIRLLQCSDSKKKKVEKNLKSKEDTIRSIISNCKRVSGVIYNSEMKAKSLKEQILQRGEDVKRNVDLIVARLIENVDNEFREHRKEAENVLKKLENMELKLRAQINVLKQQLNDLNAGNLTDATSSCIVEDDVSIPQFTGDLNLALIYSKIRLTSDLQKTVGTLKKEPKLKLIKEEKLNGNVKSFSVHREDMFVCYCVGPRVDRLERDGLVLKSSYIFRSMLSGIYDLLVVHDALYVLGRDRTESIDVIKVVRFDLSSGSVPVEIYRQSLPEVDLGLRRSGLADVLLILRDRMLHLSGSGAVVKSVDLYFDVFDALQLGRRRHVVCHGRRLYSVVDEQGLISTSHSLPGENFGPENGIRRADAPGSDCRVVADGAGSVFAVDNAGLKFHVFDEDFSHICTRSFAHPLVKVVHDERNNFLLAMSNRNYLLTYQL